MSGPRTESEALLWIQDALASGRYVPSVHIRDRLRERDINMDDVFNAIDSATGCQPYDRNPPEHQGTCWRVTGPTVDGESVAIGVEAFLDKKRRRCMLCTVFRTGE